MMNVNLIPAPRLAIRQRRIWQGRCVITCVGYAAIVAVVTAGAQAVLRHGGAEVSEQLAKASDDIDRTSNVLSRVRSELDATESLLRSSRAISEQPDWSALLGLLSARADGQVVLKAVAVRPKEIAPIASAPAARPAPGRPAKPAAAPDPTILVNIAGAAPSQSAASKFALRLEATGLFGRVTLLDTNRETYADLSLVSFRIECTLGDPTARPPASVAAVGPVTPLEPAVMPHTFTPSASAPVTTPSPSSTSTTTIVRPATRPAAVIGRPSPPVKARPPWVARPAETYASGGER